MRSKMVSKSIDENMFDLNIAQLTEGGISGMGFFLTHWGRVKMVGIL